MRDHISFKLNWINQQISKLRYAVKLINTAAMTKHNARDEYSPVSTSDLSGVLEASRNELGLMDIRLYSLLERRL